VKGRCKHEPRIRLPYPSVAPRWARTPKVSDPAFETNKMPLDFQKGEYNNSDIQEDIKKITSSMHNVPFCPLFYCSIGKGNQK